MMGEVFNFGGWRMVGEVFKPASPVAAFFWSRARPFSVDIR